MSKNVNKKIKNFNFLKMNNNYLVFKNGLTFQYSSILVQKKISLVTTVFDRERWHYKKLELTKPTTSDVLFRKW